MWLFFRFGGRLTPRPFFLAGLLIFVTEVFLLYRFAASPPETGPNEVWATLFTAFIPVSLWCNCALVAKRFHDFGKPGILAVISLLLGFVLFIVLAFIKGDSGPNAYGDRSDEPA